MNVVRDLSEGEIGEGVDYWLNLSENEKTYVIRYEYVNIRRGINAVCFIVLSFLLLYLHFIINSDRLFSFYNFLYKLYI